MIRKIDLRHDISIKEILLGRKDIVNNKKKLNAAKVIAIIQGNDLMASQEVEPHKTIYEEPVKERAQQRKITKAWI